MTLALPAHRRHNVCRGISYPFDQCCQRLISKAHLFDVSVPIVDTPHAAYGVAKAPLSVIAGHTGAAQ